MLEFVWSLKGYHNLSPCFTAPLMAVISLAKEPRESVELHRAENILLSPRVHASVLTRAPRLQNEDFSRATAILSTE